MFGLYLLDVFVSQLILNKDVYTDTGGSPLVVRVVFINFPSTEVAERKRYRKNGDLYVFKFKNGQSIEFSMTCEDLVKKLKKVPLQIGVFRVDDSFPICYLQTHLSGCACDLGSMCIEKPAPFRFRGPFDLIDPGRSFAGRLDLEITISNLGKYVELCNVFIVRGTNHVICLLTPYALAPDCFIFKTDLEGSEYKCNFKESSKVTGGIHGLFEDNGANQTMVVDTAPPGNLIKDIVGISAVAGRLATGSPPPKEPQTPLVELVATKRRKKSRKKKKGRRK